MSRGSCPRLKASCWATTCGRCSFGRQIQRPAPPLTCSSTSFCSRNAWMLATGGVFHSLQRAPWLRCTRCIVERQRIRLRSAHGTRLCSLRLHPMASRILVDAHLFVLAGANLILCGFDVDGLLADHISTLLNFPRSVSPGVTILDMQDCNLSAVFLVALAAFIEDSHDDVISPPKPPHSSFNIR